MKLFLFTAVAAGALATLGASAPADAAQGCGPGGHRGPRGYCRPNGGRPVLVAGRFYPGRGYYYNNRYYHNRYRYGGGYRYR